MSCLTIFKDQKYNISDWMYGATFNSLHKAQTVQKQYYCKEIHFNNLEHQEIWSKLIIRTYRRIIYVQSVIAKLFQFIFSSSKYNWCKHTFFNQNINSFFFSSVYALFLYLVCICQNHVLEGTLCYKNVFTNSQVKVSMWINCSLNNERCSIKWQPSNMYFLRYRFLYVTVQFRG
jgi:hypothetical protein